MQNLNKPEFIMCYQFRVDGRTVALNRCSKCSQLQRLHTTWTMFAEEVRSREKKFIHSTAIRTVNVTITGLPRLKSDLFAITTRNNIYLPPEFFKAVC